MTQVMEREGKAVQDSSQMIVWDAGTAWFIQTKLMELRRQLEIELRRDDLFPHVEASLRMKRNALNSVIGIVRGSRGGSLSYDLDIEHLVLAEFPPDDDDTLGGVELYEATTQAEAEALAEDAQEDGAITTRYAVVPETGTTVLVFHPVGTEENVDDANWRENEAKRLSDFKERQERRAQRVRVRAVTE